jgi:hypothetical protein
MNQDEIRWLAGQSAHCPTIGLTTFSSNCLPVCKVDYFVIFGTRLSFSYLIYFTIPETIFYDSRNYSFLKINFNAFYAFWGYFVLLLLVLHNFFEPKGSFTLEMDSDVHNSFISCNYAYISRLLLHYTGTGVVWSYTAISPTRLHGVDQDKYFSCF